MTLAVFHGSRCPYCGRVMQMGHQELAPTRDHVVPGSKGGFAILIVCWRCNNDKGDIMPDDYLDGLHGCRKTLARLAMIGALREALANPGRAEDMPVRRSFYSAAALFASTTMQDAFHRARRNA